MRVLRTGLSVILLGVLLVAVSGISLRSAYPVTAQDGGTCEQLAEQAISEALEACGDVARGEVCAGYNDVSVVSVESGDAALLEQSTVAVLSDTNAVTTSMADPDAGQWGVAVLDLPASTDGVMAVLFGDAQITRPQVVQADRPTLTVFNRGSAEVNLRNGAGVTYDLVGQLVAQEEAVADGRNEQGDWLRIQFFGGIGWVFTPLIGWEGDQSAVDALEVLLPNDVTPVSETGEPFQTFTLVTGESGCSTAPSGLLLQYDGTDPASVQINQVNLEFSNATVLVTASAGDALEAKVLTGETTVTARGVAQNAAVGSGVRVALGGGDGLTPLSAPVALSTYAFSDIAYAPLTILPEQVSCAVGLPQNTDVWLRVGPGTGRAAIGAMNANASYTVIGWASDPDGSPWWQLDTGEQSSWVARAEVLTVGRCDDVAQIDAPSVISPAAPVSGDSGSVNTGGMSYAPAANSVWQMIPGSDNMTGECSGAPAINFCDHLAAIAPSGNGISWKGMEPSPYVMSQTQPNVYFYSGPNSAGTGTVNMTLSFTSETTLSMTMSLVLSNEPGCQHVYYYSGTRNW